MPNNDFQDGDRITLIKDANGWRGELAFAKGKGMYSTSKIGILPNPEDVLQKIRQAAADADR